MKKINLKGISEILSEKEMKNVMGGTSTCTDCSGKSSGQSCSCPNGVTGFCDYAPFVYTLICRP